MNNKKRQGACPPAEARAQADEIAAATADAIKIKYMEGYREHGGDFRRMPLGQAAGAARDEALDLCAYIYQICRKHDEAVTLLDKAAAPDTPAVLVRALAGQAREKLAGRYYGDNTPQDDSPAADARFRALAAGLPRDDGPADDEPAKDSPATDARHVLNRLAALENAVRDLKARNRMLARRVDSVGEEM